MWTKLKTHVTYLTSIQVCKMTLIMQTETGKILKNALNTLPLIKTMPRCTETKLIVSTKY